MRSWLLALVVMLLLPAQEAVAQCDCVLNMSFERAAGSCFGQDCGCDCVPDPMGPGESWTSCPLWGCGSTDIGPNPGGDLNMGSTQPTHGSSYLSMTCSGGPNGEGEGISMTLCTGTALQAGTEYCFAIDLITRANFGSNPGTSRLVVYGSGSPCTVGETLWNSPQPTGNWATYNFCFTPTGNWSVISFRVVNAGGGFTSVALDNWRSTDGLFPPRAQDCLTAQAQGGTICPGQCADVTATAANGVPPYTYTWSGGLAPAGGPGPHPACPTTTTLYTVIVTDAAGNTATAEAVVNILTSGCLDIAATGDSICPAACGEVRATVVTGIPPYTYQWSDGLPNGPGPHRVCPDATKVYTVTVTDAGGISASAQAIVTVSGSRANAGPDRTINCARDPITLIGVTDATGGTVQWTTPDGRIIDGANTLTPTVGAPGTYILTITDGNGCTTSDTTVVRYDGTTSTGGAEVLFPNVITPNGDGINDFFSPFVAGDPGFSLGIEVEAYELAVFNRWGQLVFESDSPNRTWDGRTVAGERVSDGVYFYIARLRLVCSDGDTRERTGVVQVLN